ncbi:MAG: Rieske (2Fe-2S) protein [Planctomycetia bacterium]|nr:Rieske (2Fe-2S) protein [Planctomycetia bacterium]
MSEHESRSPKASGAAAESPPNRRSALGWLSVALGALATTAAGVPVVGYLLSPILRTPGDRWVDLGPVEEYPEKQTRLVDFVDPLHRPWDGQSERLAAYVRHDEGEKFQVFMVNCTHLGCPVSWFPQSGLFLCPCHGGVYYQDGQRASGPPPRGLYSYDSRVVDGRLQIRAGRLPTLQQPG